MVPRQLPARLIPLPLHRGGLGIRSQSESGKYLEMEMSTQNEAHGDEDTRRELTERELELALEEIVECVLEYGQWPRKGRAQFDLYDYLMEERDPSYAWEMYLCAISDNTEALENRIRRERASVESILLTHLQGSDMVQDLANERASEEE